MNIYINGQPIALTAQSTNVAAALTQFLTAANEKQSFAVALNGDFVDKAQYQNTPLTEGDCLDVLFPIQGG